MVVAGARAGVYDLRTMAEESIDCMIRAGTRFSVFFFLSISLGYWT